ncbi:armadillo-type protein [Diplogelasinospora grovesii]|uniref:Armadillo-type protein n=1 Tax=Diplogelasinospora grovesii TaxID=303347 RepID=A0AAN6NIA9_9PEZI|nr:armadillo-type protein [Diplogelasinospora grovesii]
MSAVVSTGSPNERRVSASFSKTFSQDENTKYLDEYLVQSPQKMKIKHEPPSPGSYLTERLYTQLSEQQVNTANMKPHNESRKSSDDEGLFIRTLEHQSSCSSLPITPATETFGTTAPTTRSASTTPTESQAATDEVLRLKLELAQAQNKIVRLDQELAQTRSLSVNPESGRATPAGLAGLLSEPEFSPSVVRTVSPISVTSRFAPGPTFNGPAKPAFSRDNNWAVHDDARSDTSDSLSAGALNRSRAIWTNGKTSFISPSPFPQAPVSISDGPQPAPWPNSRSLPQLQGYDNSFVPPAMEAYRPDRMTPDHEIVRPAARRGNRYDNRFGGPSNFSGGYGGYNLGPSQFDAASAYPSGAPGAISGGGMGGGMGLGGGLYPPYQPQPVRTPLSPHATEFTSGGAPWKTESLTSEGQTYLPATEPLNYRRLLDRNVTCDWKYIVDKIVCNNDQQASIFLQQKLKVGTPEQKYDIVEAIVAQAYPLMVNRFGNFLVQRCFEHGTPEQVVKIADAIRGNTLNLSMDPFGCHVVQKAFDSVPENYKAIMVHELLRRIPETVIHRYACHVWQKLFELRWTESPPQIMKYVNEALCGMWHEVALGETGSLVVQNIFENCLEEDKRPCIEEVLQNIDIVAHGQFGNWCIQHICEHGAPADRSRAIDHVIRYAAEYSMDQFASKVVEKCLKIGGTEFLGRYLDRVCEGRHDRPRIPLIDIASDQYGNYLIQYILTHANPQHREVVAAHIRKHMVSLRGSKFGSRVGMLCTNHAVATRPGPGVGPAIGSRMVPGPRYNAPYR